MVPFRNDVAPRRPTLKKILYHPLTLIALGLHAFLLVVPLSTSIPWILKVCLALAVPIAALFFLSRYGLLSRPSSFKKSLYQPLVWAAIGFHALLLLVPFSTAKPSAEETESVAEEAMPVDILNLSELAAPPPPAAPPPQSAVSAPTQAPPAAAMPAPQPVQPAPVQQPTPTAAPAAQPSVANTLAPVPTPQTTPPPTNTQPPGYDPSASRNGFISGLDQGALSSLGVKDLTAQGLPTASRFRNSNAQFFLGATALSAPELQQVNVGDAGALPPGAVSAKVLDGSKKDALKKMQTGYESVGITFVPVPGGYGDEGLYEMKEASGETFAYVSLVDFIGSSFMVLWSDLPQ